MRNLFIVFSLLFFLTGCTHKMILTDFDKGEVLEGHYTEMTKKVEVLMPNGEILKGKYSAISNSSFTFTNSTSTATAYSGTASAFGTGSSFGTGYSIGGAGKAYALLKSETSNLMMELLVDYNAWDGSGFGEARTNDGRRYKVQF